MSIFSRLRETVWGALTPTPIRRLLATVQTQLSEPGWLSLTGSGIVGVDQDPIMRKDALDASRYYWQRDPLYGRAIRLCRNYTFGRGISWQADDEQVKKILTKFWDDPDNAVLARAQGQWELADRFQVYGELFLVFFVNRYNGHVKVTTIEPEEITRVISDPHNSRNIQYYERTWMPLVFDWSSKQHKRSAMRIDFYPDWGAKETRPDIQAGVLSECKYCGQYTWRANRHIPTTCAGCGARLIEAAVTVQDETGAAFATVGTAHTAVYVHQWKVNSFGERGIPPYYSAITWVKAYKGFMEDRATVTLAAATFAFKQKIKGGAQAVARLVTQWGNAIAGRYGGWQAGRERAEGAQTIIENEASNLEQLNFDTRASNAYQDGRMLRQQVSAATDITEPDLTGDPSVGNLASMTAMNGPQLKGFESWQQLFQDLYRDVFDFVIRMAVIYGELSLVATNEQGQKVERDLNVETDFPPIVTRDLGDIVTAVASLISAQTAAGQEYISPERLARTIIAAFGETDVEAALEELDFEAQLNLPGGVENELRAAIEALRLAVEAEE